ncbi:hypothetical protein FHW67_001662 [Herbaspirillum sp. Sphag1AN]|nr:hypothetical protein [Herbaspirillum sp. Sphag1AN]MBB3245519.1 hypothetical protein [Herbaspirillum sp. Sphag64]
MSHGRDCSKARQFNRGNLTIAISLRIFRKDAFLHFQLSLHTVINIDCQRPHPPEISCLLNLLLVLQLGRYVVFT